MLFVIVSQRRLQCAPPISPLYHLHSPPTPSTPITVSKYSHLPGYDDSFDTNPLLLRKSVSVSLQSDKENNTPSTTGNKPQRSKQVKPLSLQLPKLSLPKNSTQFKLLYSPFTPSSLSPSYELPQFPDIPIWDTLHSQSPIPTYSEYFQFPSPSPPLFDPSASTNQIFADLPALVSPPPACNKYTFNSQPNIRNFPYFEYPTSPKRGHFAMDPNEDQYHNQNHPNKRRKIDNVEFFLCILSLLLMHIFFPKF